MTQLQKKDSYLAWYAQMMLASILVSKMIVRRTDTKFFRTLYFMNGIN